MITQRLALLCLLVAVAGGCSMWYTTKILPASIPDSSEISPVAKHSGVKPVTTAAKPKGATPIAVTTNTNSTASALTDDISAIAASADATTYDDSSLNADVTNSEAASLTTAYGI